MTVAADDLDRAMSCVMSGLLPLTDRDWSVRAGSLEWDCWHTAEHIGDCLLSYAWQLAVQPTARYVRAVATAEKDASPAEVLESPSPAAASWPGSSRTRRPTWPTPTRGPRCCGQAAASNCPTTRSSQPGAPIPPP
jgi:hypothetical protein